MELSAFSLRSSGWNSCCMIVQGALQQFNVLRSGTLSLQIQISKFGIQSTVNCRTVVPGVLQPRCDNLAYSDLELSSFRFRFPDWSRENCCIIIQGVLQPRCGNLAYSDLELSAFRFRSPDWSMGKCRIVIQGVLQPRCCNLAYSDLNSQP